MPNSCSKQLPTCGCSFIVSIIPNLTFPFFLYSKIITSKRELYWICFCSIWHLKLDLFSFFPDLFFLYQRSFTLKLLKLLSTFPISFRIYWSEYVEHYVRVFAVQVKVKAIWQAQMQTDGSKNTSIWTEKK